MRGGEVRLTPVVYIPQPRGVYGAYEHTVVVRRQSPIVSSSAEARTHNTARCGHRDSHSSRTIPHITRHILRPVGSGCRRHTVQRHRILYLASMSVHHTHVYRCGRGGYRCTRGIHRRTRYRFRRLCGELHHQELARLYHHTIVKLYLFLQARLCGHQRKRVVLQISRGVTHVGQLHCHQRTRRLQPCRCRRGQSRRSRCLSRHHLCDAHYRQLTVLPEV